MNFKQLLKQSIFLSINIQVEISLIRFVFSITNFPAKVKNQG
jgi:hypothetical protein